MTTSFNPVDGNYIETYLAKDCSYEVNGMKINENPFARGDKFSYLNEGDPKDITAELFGDLAEAIGVAGEADRKTLLAIFKYQQHPETGESLGRKQAQFKNMDQAVAEEMKRLAPGMRLSGVETEEDINAIRKSVRRRLQKQKKIRRNITSVEILNAVPKSISALRMALEEMAKEGDADAQVRLDELVAALAKANQDFLLQEVQPLIRTRFGMGSESAVAQQDGMGIIAGTWKHKNARPTLLDPKADPNDPNSVWVSLPHDHFHNLISAKTRAKSPDGSGEIRFMAVDTATLRDARQTLAPKWDLFAAQVVADLGWDIVMPAHQLGLAQASQTLEVKGLDKAELIEDLSGRHRDIHNELNRLLEEFQDENGRQPTPTEEAALTKIAWQDTRAAKGADSGATPGAFDDILTKHLGKDWRGTIKGLQKTADKSKYQERDFSFAKRREIARIAIAELELEGHTSWTQAKLEARVVAVIKNTIGTQISAEETRKLIHSSTFEAEQICVRLNHIEMVEGRLADNLSRRANGENVFTRTGETRYTSTPIMRMENYIGEQAQRTSPHLAMKFQTVDKAREVAEAEAGFPMAEDQWNAVRELCSNSRYVTYLFGPPGAGKTTTLRTVRHAVELDGGRTIVLAASQKAANVAKEAGGFDLAFNITDFQIRTIRAQSTDNAFTQIHRKMQEKFGKSGAQPDDYALLKAVRQDRKKYTKVQQRSFSLGKKDYLNDPKYAFKLERRRYANPAKQAEHDAWLEKKRAEHADRMKKKQAEHDVWFAEKEAKFKDNEQAARAELRSVKLKKGDRIIVDESSLTSLHDFTWLIEAATKAQAQIIFTGDPEQLGAVGGAGGAFSELIRTGQGAELTSVWRFWTTDAAGNRVRDEKLMSLAKRVRDGDVTVARDLIEGGYVQWGSREEMQAASLRDWENDLKAGQRNMMMVRTNEQRAEMAARGLEILRQNGHLGKDYGITLPDGTPIVIGAPVVARQNDGEIRFKPKKGDRRGDKISNRHEFTIVGYNSFTDGLSIKSDENGQVLTVPRQYWESGGIESALVTTFTAAQGQTVYGANPLADRTTTRQEFLIGATRATHVMRTYLVTDEIDPSGARQAVYANPEDLLAGVIRNDQRDVSAHEEIDRDWKYATSIEHLSAKHRYFSDLDRVGSIASIEHLVEEALSPQVDVDLETGEETITLKGPEWMDEELLENVRSSSAWPTLGRHVLKMRAELGSDEKTVEAIREAAARGSFETKSGPGDPAKLLHYRLGGRATEDEAPALKMDTVSVVLPWLQRSRNPDVHSEAQQAMQAYEEAALGRVVHLTDRAVREDVAWLAHLAERVEPGHEDYGAYLEAVAAAAAYRERYGVYDDASLLGDWAPTPNEHGKFKDEDQRRLDMRHHVEQVIDRYVQTRTTTPETDPVREAFDERLSRVPGAFGLANGLQEESVEREVAAPSAERELSMEERSFGSFLDEELREELAVLDRTVADKEANLPRLVAEIEKAEQQQRAAEIAYRSDNGAGMRALLGRKAMYQEKRKERLELDKLREERQRKADEADAELKSMGSRKKWFGVDQKMLDKDALHEERHREIAEVDDEIRRLERSVGSEAQYAVIKAEANELAANWESEQDTARKMDARAVKRCADEVKRLNKEHEKAEKDLKRANSQKVAILAEEQRRGQQAPQTREAEHAVRVKNAEARRGQAQQKRQQDTDYVISIGGKDLSPGRDLGY